jgi:hypothetical protein
MSWLTFLMAFELALSSSTFTLPDAPQQISGTVPETRLEVGVVAFDLLHVHGATSIFTAWPDNPMPGGWVPVLADFEFGVSLNWRGLSVGYDYLCRHGVWPGIDNSYRSKGAAERIFIRVEALR